MLDDRSPGALRRLRAAVRSAHFLLALAVAVAAVQAAPAASRHLHAPIVISVADTRLVFAWGECTYWAAKKRGDIPRAALEEHVSGDWNARGWVSIARRTGFRISLRPAAGWLAAWQPGSGGAGALGHLAYVESVRANGSYVVSEMNWDGIAAATRRRVPPGTGAVFIGPLRATGAGRDAGKARG